MPTPEGFTTRPVGLDFGAVMTIASAIGADTAMLVDILPRVEAAIVNPRDEWQEDDDDAD